MPVRALLRLCSLIIVASTLLRENAFYCKRTHSLCARTWSRDPPAVRARLSWPRFSWLSSAPLRVPAVHVSTHISFFFLVACTCSAKLKVPAVYALFFFLLFFSWLSTALVWGHHCPYMHTYHMFLYFVFVNCICSECVSSCDAECSLAIECVLLL